MNFTPQKSRGLALGAGLWLALASVGLLSLALIVALPPSPLTLALILAAAVSLPAAGWAAYRLWALFTARYTLDRNALTVAWGARREIIPLDQIEEVHAATEFEGDLTPRGLQWPGGLMSRVAHPTLGALEFLATTPDKAGLVLVGYPGGWLALSPHDPAAFVAAFAERRAEGVETAPEPESRRWALPEWSVWHDRLALGLIALGGAALFALAAYLILIFPQLPAQMALRFDAQGLPSRFGPPAGLFILPVIGLVAWLLNTLGGVWLHRRAAERPAAYLLFGAALLVQALVWVAALGLLTAGAPA
jgi:hypothetical protein